MLTIQKYLPNSFLDLVPGTLFRNVNQFGVILIETKVEEKKLENISTDLS
jgi:hypothetical protein